MTDEVRAGRPRVVLGVGGGIAAYKSASLLRLFTESGHDVTVVPTRAALEFVGAATWAALSGRPVSTDVWAGAHEVPHVRIGQHADLVIVAPATADLLAKAAHGLADDLLTNTLLTARCPIVFAPAMHTEMWEHPATQANVGTLRSRGALVIEPAAGRLTGADTGPGRLPEPEEIFEVCRRVLARGSAGPDPDLVGRRVLVTAGGTREPIDPVRFIGNRASGRQGYALARAAVARGAEVVLIAANTELADPAGVKVIPVTTTAQLRDAVLAEAAVADVVVMAAAVADFRPEKYHGKKIKKVDDSWAPTVPMVQNPHVLRELTAHRARAGQIVVGFAAETGDSNRSAIETGRDKLERYGVDLLVVNEVGADKAFGSPDNEAVIFDAAGGKTAVGYGPKEALADRIWDLVSAALHRPS
ncbi:MAG TPA: bifunctional phosphopantothenoylcysteine decarboxylase/phosphopantothenate--cysteine ligase CoaBC [Actinomycetes bacterium]|nr:bifunctional phosphopantothenoylcysteine decarboxylase/phosphopantothenate--cysteine ligase CoaBC [Actinomycetes bacterium]